MKLFPRFFSVRCADCVSLALAMTAAAGLGVMPAAPCQAEDLFVNSTAGSGWPGGPVGMYNRAAFGRVDVDCDINYDGIITNDGSDGGDLERNPPGLVIGSARMAKLLFRVTPLSKPGQLPAKTGELDLEKLVARLEVRPINLLRRDGLFLKTEDEAKAGHIKVWADAKRSRLLLDSADTGKRRVDWKLAASAAPGEVYVECVTPADAVGACIVTLEVDDISRNGYKEGKHNALAPRDFILITAKEQGMEIKSDPRAGQGKHSLGFGNYAGFSKSDKDSIDVWVPVTRQGANGALSSRQ